ncbi:MAG TPA: metal-binding protein [Lachnospiraceae bacterium]|nr:metal-binding protein [Lachnospiraceae bacterium]
MKNSYCFFENKECEYFPCHDGLEYFNCLFCYCPLYGKKHCPGNPEWMKKNEEEIKVCTNCTFPHRPENYEAVIHILKGNGK